MLWVGEGSVLPAWFDHTCPLRVKCHYRSIQSCCEWSPLPSAIMAAPPSAGHEMPQKGSTWCALNATAIAAIRFQEKKNNCVRFGTDSALHQNTSFLADGGHPSSRGPDTLRICSKAHWSCSGSVWWPNTWLRHFLLTFPLIWHLCLCYMITGSYFCSYDNKQRCTIGSQVKRELLGFSLFPCGLSLPSFPSSLHFSHMIPYPQRDLCMSGSGGWSQRLTFFPLSILIICLAVFSPSS